MRNIIIIILLSFTSLCFSQNKNQEKDKILADSMSNLSKRVNELDKKMRDMSEEINSFKSVIQEYSVARSYFFVIFSGVVTGIGIVMTLIVVVLNNLSRRDLMREVDGKIKTIQDNFKNK